MAEKTVAMTSGKQTGGGRERERTRAEEQYILPPVDIYEVEDRLVLLADLPGVSANDLDVRLEESILTIKAKARHAVEAEPIYREFRLVNFFRQFELSDEVDRERISARMNHGVLTLELPKAEKAKPRQIAVQVEETKAAA